MLKKFGLGLVLAFGLVACDDSSSSSSDDNGGNGGSGSNGGNMVKVTCKVQKENPLTIKSSEGNYSGTITYELKDGKIVETYNIDSESLAKKQCDEMKSDEDFGKVSCDGKKIVATHSESSDKKMYDTYVSGIKNTCKAMDGKMVNADDDSGSQNNNNSNDGNNIPKVETSSCNFNLNDNVWEYSYSVGKDATGTSSKGTVRYEFKGKSLTKTTTTTSTGSLIPTVCENYKAGDYEDEDEEGSFKMETTCKGNDMIIKSTDVTLDYEKSYATKEEILQSAKAQCGAYSYN